MRRRERKICIAVEIEAVRGRDGVMEKKKDEDKRDRKQQTSPFPPPILLSSCSSATRAQLLASTCAYFLLVHDAILRGIFQRVAPSSQREPEEVIGVELPFESLEARPVGRAERFSDVLSRYVLIEKLECRICQQCSSSGKEASATHTRNRSTRRARRNDPVDPILGRRDASQVLLGRLIDRPLMQRKKVELCFTVRRGKTS